MTSETNDTGHTPCEPCSDVIDAIIDLDAQATRCFLTADKLVQTDLPKAKRLVALGIQCQKQAAGMRKIWNDTMASSVHQKMSANEAAKMQASADRMLAGLNRTTDQAKIARKDLFA